ncbi:MAG: YdcH family protein [Pseudomonadota bacterium]
MSAVDHIEALRAKHASLDQAIAKESTRPHPDDDAICSLKKKKLQIKDEIVRLSSTVPDTTH